MRGRCLACSRVFSLDSEALIPVHFKGSDGRLCEGTLTPPTFEPPLYYIQNRGFSGNCLFWWKPDGHGYTADLKKAWKVTAEQAKRICRDRPEEDIPRLVEEMDQIAQLHVYDSLVYPTVTKKV